MNAQRRAAGSIVERLSWRLAVLAAVGLALFGALVYLAVRLQIDARQQQQLDRREQKLIDIAVKAAAEDADLAARAAGYAVRRGGTRLSITTADGRLVYRDPEQAPFVLSPHVVERRFAAGPDDGLPQRLEFHLQVDALDDALLLERLALMLAVAVPIGALAIAMVARSVTRRGLAPLRELGRQTRALQPDRLGERLQLAAPVDELQAWVEPFNELLGRLEQAYAQLESFNADVAHELRTPLANLIGQTEVALSRPRAAAELAETLHSNLEELQRLSVLIHDMLLLSRADRGVAARRGEALSLAALLGQVVEFHEPAFEERGLAVQLEGDLSVAVDEGLFKRAASNLLDNATRFAAAGSSIRIAVEAARAGGAARVTVENRGTTIPAEQLPRIFDRFFRVDAARPDGGAHHGLGLAIVAAIARMHAGRTHAESADGVTRIGFEVARV